MKKAEESTVPTNNKKVEVHDATEKTTDVTPKQTETEHEKQVLTGTLAQKAAQVSQALTKKALREWTDTVVNGEKVIPGMAEDSALSRANHEIAKDEFLDAPDRRAFGYMAPKVLGGAGNLIGGRLGGAVGKLTGQGLGIAAELGTAFDNSATRRDAMIEDNNADLYEWQKINPAAKRPFEPAAPKPAPQLPVGQPRPPVAQPPRGLGSAGLNKAGSFSFGQKVSNDFLGGLNDYGKTYMHYTQSNPVWNGARAVGRSVDALTDPKNHEQPLRAAGNALLGKPAPAPAPAPVNGDYTQSNPVWNGLRSAGRAINTFTDPRNGSDSSAGPKDDPLKSWGRYYNGYDEKAGAFSFGTKIANGWMGLNSSRNGPGGVISTKTLPKADATAKNWGPAGQLPPPSLGTRAAVPGAAQAPQQPAMKQILQKQVPMVPVKKGSHTQQEGKPMNAFQFGQIVKLSMLKSAATPADAMRQYGLNPQLPYPHLANTTTHPEFTPRTAPERFRGVQVEADIPPRIFPNTDMTDNPMDVDNAAGVFSRQQSGQGLNTSAIGGDAPTYDEMKNRNQAMNNALSYGAQQRKMFSRARGLGTPPDAPVLPAGQPRPPAAPAKNIFNK